MTEQVTVTLSNDLSERVRQLAKQREQDIIAIVETILSEHLPDSVEAQAWIDLSEPDEAAVEVFLATADAPVGLPFALAEEIAQVPFLDDAHLWQAARQVAPLEKNERIQALVLKQQAEGLTAAEQQEVQQLQQYAHRLMLVRAKAAVLLQQRGYDISVMRQRVPSAPSEPAPGQLAA